MDNQLYDLYLLVHPTREFYIGVTKIDTSDFIVTDTCFYRNYLNQVEKYNKKYDIKNFIVSGPEDYSQKIIDTIKQTCKLNETQNVKFQEERRI